MKVFNTEKSAKSRALRLVLVLGVLLVSVLLLDSFFGSQSPNFYAVRKQAQSFEVPADWEYVGYSENRGTWGLWCYQVSGSECPFYRMNYTGPGTPDQSISREIKQLLEINGYSSLRETVGRCNETGNERGVFSCGFEGVLGDFSVDVTATPGGEPGVFEYSIRATR